MMCANVGVDPLASNKGMFAQLLGIGDFYYQLGVQIIEACLATRTHNGGMVELSLLRHLVQVRLGSMAQLIDAVCPAPLVCSGLEMQVIEACLSASATQLTCPCRGALWQLVRLDSVSQLVDGA